MPGPADVAKIDAQVLRDPGVHATPADFGAGIGAAVADFGKAASRVASDFAEMRREAEDDTAATAGLADARVRFTKVAQSMEAQATSAEGFTDNLGAALTDETEAIVRDLREVRGLRPSERGEAAIRGQLGLLASRMVARGAMFEQRARLSQLGHAVDFSVGDFAMAAFNRPANFPAIIEEMEASLARFENKLPPGILAAKVTAARTTIGESAVAGLIEKDPATALAALEGGTFDRVLAPPGKAVVLKQARAAVAVGDKAAVAEVAAAIEDHLVSLQTTGAGLGGITERARAALDGKAFKAFERDEKDALAFHQTMESLKFAPPDVIDRELETRRPKRGARNFAGKQRRFRVLERGAKQMLNLRARDGAAFVMEIGDVRTAFERAGTDGPDLRRALKFRMAMQADIGMPEDRIRLLTRAEAGALANQVQSAAVEDKAAKVAGLQDLYGPLFGRAMKELTQAGLDPRFQVLAVARDNPVLARTIVQVIGTEHVELVNGLDGAAVKDLRRRLRDLAPDGRSAAAPGGETAGEIKAVLSVAGDLGLWNLRQTGNVEEAATRTAAFTNDAVERILVAAAGDEDIVRDMVLRREDQQGVVGPLGPARPIDEDSQDAQPLAEKVDKGGEALENKGTGEDGHDGGEGSGEDDTAAGEEPDPTAGAEEQAAPGATRGERPDQSRRSVEDLRRLYREGEIPDDVARTLAKTGVVPQVEPTLDGKKVELIRAVRDLDPKDEKAVKALRKRIQQELGRSPEIHSAFQLEVTARIAGRKKEPSVRQLARFAVIGFGREIDPENAKLLAAVLEATPENLKDVLGRINRRFDGLSGGSVAYKGTLRGVIQFKQTGGKQGLSPEAAAGQLMPYVDGRIAEGIRKVAKIAIDILTLGRSGLIAEAIKIINFGDSVLSQGGTKRQQQRIRKRIGGK